MLLTNKETVKLGDFGLSRKMDESDSYYVASKGPSRNSFISFFLNYQMLLYVHSTRIRKITYKMDEEFVLLSLIKIKYYSEIFV